MLKFVKIALALGLVSNIVFAATETTKKNETQPNTTHTQKHSMKKEKKMKHDGKNKKMKHENMKQENMNHGNMKQEATNSKK